MGADNYHLGLELGFEVAELERIDIDNRDNSLEKMYQTLLRWKEKNINASFENLDISVKMARDGDRLIERYVKDL